MKQMFVTSAKNPLAYLKAIAAFVGAIVTALLTIYVDGEVGRVLTVIGVVVTAIATYGAPNAEVVPEQGEYTDDGFDPNDTDAEDVPLVPEVPEYEHVLAPEEYVEEPEVEEPPFDTLMAQANGEEMVSEPVLGEDADFDALPDRRDVPYEPGVTDPALSDPALRRL